MLIIQGGKVLSVSRKDDKTKWGLPGGKRDPEDISAKETAIRETYEETGITVLECELIFDRLEPGIGENPVDYHSYCYYATEYEGIASKQEEGEVDWLNYKELISDVAPFKEYNKLTFDKFNLLFPDLLE